MTEEGIEEAIRVEMARKRKKQKHLAKDMGFTEPKMSRCINDIGTMKMGDFIKMCRKLGLTITIE